MSEQMAAIKGIFADALAELTPEQVCALTMAPYDELRADQC